MNDSAGKIIDKLVKWGIERIIAALHTIPQGKQPPQILYWHMKGLSILRRQRYRPRVRNQLASRYSIRQGDLIPRVHNYWPEDGGPILRR